MSKRWWILLPFLAHAAFAQSVPLVLEGDVIPGLGAVTGVHDVAVNDAGDWLALVSCGATRAVLRNGAVALQSGDALSTPGLSVQGLESPDLNDAGDASWNVLTGPGAHTVALGASALLSTGDPATLPGFLPGSIYQSFADADLNAQRAIAVLAVVDEPGPGVDRAILRVQVDAAGALASVAKVVQDGDAIAGAAAPVLLIDGHGHAINDQGDVIYDAWTPAGRVIARNQTALAVQGGQSPVFGRLWHAFGRSDLNDAGDHVFAALLTGSADQDAILSWNGVVLAREGDVLPAIAPYALRERGSLAVDQGSSLWIADDGRVAWYGEWTEPDAERDGGIFVDHALVVREGVSLGGGVPLAELGAHDLPFAISDDGRRLVFTARRADGVAGAFLLELGGDATPYSGCAPSAGTLALASAPLLGQTAAFELDHGQADGVVALVAIASALPEAFPPCGIPLGAAGEVLIDVAPPNPIAVLGPAPWPTLGIPGVPAWLSVAVPDHPALLGLELFAQGLFADPAGLAPREPLRLTNGVRMRIGFL